MDSKIVLVDFCFSKYVDIGGIRYLSSFLPPCKWKRFISIFTHKLYLTENFRLEESISEADVVILFDTRKNYDEVAKRIERFCKSTAKLILYLWNPKSDSDAHFRLSDRWIKTTFSKKDAASGEFKYVGSFYFKNVSNFNLPVKYDGLFVGQDKGRKDLLYDVASLFNRNCLKSKIILVDNRKALYNRQYSFRLNYDDVCKYVQESKTVIEILQKGQEGISLRVFESLFYEKKLITNNQQIVNYDFYNPSNIFILGKDDEAHFKEFVLSPYVKIHNDIVSRYTMECWLLKMLSL